MFRNSCNPWRETIHRLFPRAILLIVMLGSAGLTTPASAAESNRPKAKTITTIFLDKIQWPKEPICVKRNAFISVITMADKDISLGHGKVAHISAAPINGVTVKASLADPSIGTLRRDTTVSGSDDLADPGQALFTLDPQKAGTTTLKLTPMYKGKNGETEVKEIKVLNCEYKVTMNAIDIDSRDGVIIWTTGNLEAKIAGDGNALRGSSNFEFVSGFVGPTCSISYSKFDNPTTITGQFDNNRQLTLQFKYEPGKITSNVSCPGFAGSASRTIDLTNTGVASATFPEDGGTQMIRFTYAASDMAPGTMIIHVEPVSAEAGP